MRIIVRLDERQTARRRLAADPGIFEDREAHALAAVLWRAVEQGTALVSAGAVDLEDASGTYLYTIEGEER